MKYPVRDRKGKILVYAFILLISSQFSLHSNAQTNADTLNGSVGIDSSGSYETQEKSTEDNTGQASRLPDTIDFRSVPDTVANRMKAKKEFEYANDPQYWIKKNEEKTESKDLGYFIDWVFNNSRVRIVMYILLSIILLYTLYRIIVNNDLFYSSSKKINEAGAEAVSEMEDDALDEKIEAAINEREFRKAVRYLFFKTLRGLDAKGWIRYHPQATNFDYLNQASKYNVAADFGFLTQVYEYVWYGGFELTEEQFNSVHDKYKEMFKVTGI